MNDLRLTQNQLAKILNVTQPAISKYLQGRVPPPFVLLELSRLSGKSIEWILTGDDQGKIKPQKVAESKNSYIAAGSLEAKIKLLSVNIRRKIESLIDSILEDHHDI